MDNSERARIVNEDGKVNLTALFQWVGASLFAEGLVPIEYTSEEWAQNQAELLGRKLQPPTANEE